MTMGFFGDKILVPGKWPFMADSPFIVVTEPVSYAGSNFLG